MIKMLIFGYFARQEVQAELTRLRPVLHQHRIVQEVDLGQKNQQKLLEADLALVLGGDGTILRAAQHMGYQQIPTLGVNLGKLGFLADIKQEDALPVLGQLLQQGFAMTEHLMLECAIHSSKGTQTMLGLNEIVIHANPPLHLIHIDLLIDDEPIATLSGDGLIVSTPIGSTGHNLSAGGPILRQELPAFVITPICPHALTNRPLVDSAERVLTMSLHPGSNLAVVSVDGQNLVPITPEHRVTVKQAPVKFRRVRVPGRSYYSTLREKLYWAVQPLDKR